MTLVKNPLLKFGLLTSAMSLSGIPVFAAFFVKYLIYSELIAFQEFVIIVPVVILTLIPIYYYIRLAQIAFLTKEFDPKFDALYITRASNFSAAHVFTFSILILFNLIILAMQIIPSFLL
jgi:NADH:ubiquinone oxidoreductase subunit 2 (subunit N)